MSPPFNVVVGLVLRWDGIAGLALKREIEGVWPKANVHFYQEAGPALAFIKSTPVDLAIVGSQTEDADGLDYIPEIADQKLVKRLIILTDRTDDRTLAAFRRPGVHAILDAFTSNPQELTNALLSESGALHISRTLEKKVIEASSRIRAQPLTELEEFTLSVLGTGIHSDFAAQVMGIGSEAMRTRKGRIMSKLEIHSQAKLIEYAQTHYYVRRTKTGMIHPGFKKALREMLERNKSMLPTGGCCVA